MKYWIHEFIKHWHLKYLVVGAGLKERCSDYLPVAVLILNATQTAILLLCDSCAPADSDLAEAGRQRATGSLSVAVLST